MEGVELLEGLAKANWLYYSTQSERDCLELQVEGPGGGEDTWDYQTCTEMLPQEEPYWPTNGVTDMFWDQGEYSFEHLSDHCMKKFGVTPRQNWAALQYGGKDVVLWYGKCLQGPTFSTTCSGRFFQGLLFCCQLVSVNCKNPWTFSWHRNSSQKIQSRFDHCLLRGKCAKEINAKGLETNKLVSQTVCLSRHVGTQVVGSSTLETLVIVAYRSSIQGILR
eukprot:TRINITY_DN4621_c0_g1_i10.p1 TRINITY_DN4621_c0_g1~~TRINITY_DN4621_c0_g1_i10.p1  ORF type:complete len:221 (-),score=14.74 TRINITY_DN4621_c0_g1_i10:195-857(-)